MGYRLGYLPMHIHAMQSFQMLGPQFESQPSHIKSITCAYNRPVRTEIVRKNFCDHETPARGVRARPFRYLVVLYRLIQVSFQFIGRYD